MRLISTLLSGFQKTLRSGKFILLTWSVTFLLGALFAFPLKAGIKGAIGKSLILDRIKDGFIIDVFADMGRDFSIITIMGLSGFLLVVFAGFMINAFLTRGIFGVLRYNTTSAGFSDFFAHSAKNYWSFLGISVLLRLATMILMLILLYIPLSALGPGRSLNHGTVVTTSVVAGICFLFIIPVFIQASDYARAWLVVHPATSFMKSLAKGFSLAFNRFFISYFYVLLLCALQVAFFLLVFNLMNG